MRKLTSRIAGWEYSWLGLFVVVSTLLHLSIAGSPAQLMADEQHYVPAARNIVSAHMDLRLEHPPLAKLLIVAGIQLGGDEPLGWRLPSILFGAAILVLFFLVCRKLGLSRTTSNVATFLLTFENLSFVQAGVATLDVFFVAFMLLAFLMYLHREYLVSGLSLALSALCKVYGFFAAPVVAGQWLFSRKQHPWRLVFGLLVSAVAFLTLLVVLDFAITHRFENPAVRIKEMLSLSGSLTFANTTHPALSRPWEWIVSYKAMAYWYTPHYTAALSPTVWVMIVPAAAYMFYLAVRRDEGGLFGVSWIVGTYVLLVPISMVTNRISFVYYFYPTVGAVCMGMGMGGCRLMEAADRLRSASARASLKAGLWVFAGLHVVAFLLLSPLTGWLNYHVAG